MALLDVIVILLVVGVVLYLVSIAPFVDARMKTLITWIIIIAVILWLISLTGILGKFSEIKFPHF